MVLMGLRSDMRLIVISKGKLFMKINKMIKREFNIHNSWKVQIKGLNVTPSNFQLKNPNLKYHNPKNPKFSTIKVPRNCRNMIKKWKLMRNSR